MAFTLTTITVLGNTVGVISNVGGSGGKGELIGLVSSTTNLPINPATDDTLQAIAATLSGTATVAGAVSVSNFPATQPVSGTVGLSAQSIAYPTTANKSGTPSAARGAGYTMTGGGSTDDCINFGATVSTVTVQNNIGSNITLAWGTGSSTGKSATLGDTTLVGGQNGILTIPNKADWVAINAPAGTVLNGTVTGIVLYGSL